MVTLDSVAICGAHALAFSVHPAGGWRQGTDRSALNAPWWNVVRLSRPILPKSFAYAVTRDREEDGWYQ